METKAPDSIGLEEQKNDEKVTRSKAKFPWLETASKL
jgi:hypothetical protein